MRKFLIGAAASLMALLSAAPLQAQMPAGMQIPAAPIDSAVRIGKLDNGLTYYIRHNENPKGQADFYIAQSVGSILENDEQRGLAHFLEHMCFNGTQSFPGNSLIDWLETVGVKFGYNLNARTGVEATIYNISSVPVARKGVQDSCLMIIHDWADGLLLDPAEIEKERGVIHEEWRRSNVGQMKIVEQLLPKIYPDSKYGYRLPIGTMEVVDNFKPQVLRDYYEKWYRPDNQAVIVVGDIDVDYIEGKIKELFSPIKMPANPAERVYEPVADTPGTIWAIGHDKEMQMSLVSFAFKQKEPIMPRELRNTMAIFGINYLTSMIQLMVNERLSDMAAKADCPFAQASIDIGPYLISDTKDALDLTIIPKGNDIRPAVQSAYRELLRAARGGFTVSEYDRAKDKYVSGLERMYQQRDGRENTAYAEEYAEAFTNNTAIPGIAYEYQLAKQFAAMIPLEAINQMLPQLISPDNRVFLACLPETDTFLIPTDADMDTAIKSVEAEDIEPFKEELKSEPFIPQEPKAVKGKVSRNKQWDATQVVYPNGAKVIIKPTAFKPGEIIFQAIAKGGMSAVDVNPADARMLKYTASTNGYGTYNNTDVKKYLSGKQTSLDMSITSYYRELDGTTTPKNVQTLMELIYMTFRDYTITKDDFEGVCHQLKAVLANQQNNPTVVFQTGMLKNIYQTPYNQMISVEDTEKASVDETLALVRHMFANPGDFTFVFTGDFDATQLMALTDKYIGSLSAPRIAGIPYVVKPAFDFTTGADTVKDKMAMAEPQVWCSITMSANMPYTAKGRIAASMAGQILSNRLLKKIREEMGATYSIGAVTSMSRVGDQNVTLRIPFPMNPQSKDQVLAEIDKMVNGMASDIKDEEFAPAQEYMVKNAIESKEKNDDIAGAITATTLNGVDTFNNAVDDIKAVTIADVRDIMKALIKANNYRVYLLEPAE